MRTNPFTETGVQYLYTHTFPPRFQLTEEERLHWILKIHARMLALTGCMASFVM